MLFSTYGRWVGPRKKQRVPFSDRVVTVGGRHFGRRRVSESASKRAYEAGDSQPVHPIDTQSDLRGEIKAPGTARCSLNPPPAHRAMIVSPLSAVCHCKHP
jgi:hypothetical protein